MKIKLNKESFKKFLMRRRVNFMSLLAMTAAVIIITVICGFMGFKRTGLLAYICVLMVVLCLIYAVKLHGSFTTIRAFRGIRRRRKEKKE